MLIIVDFAIIKGGNIYCFSFLYNNTGGELFSSRIY